MKNLLFLVLLFTISSCFQNSIEFEILNWSKDNINNINISASGQLNTNIIKLNKFGKAKYTLDMSKIPKTDGSYLVRLNRNGVADSIRFGYYTNGYPLDNKFIVVILEDEINYILQ